VTLYRANCIFADSTSFYHRALAARDRLRQAQPDDDEVLQLEEPCAVAAVAKLPIPDENPLKDLCGKIFGTAKHTSCKNQLGYSLEDGTPYELLIQLEFDDDALFYLSASRQKDNNAEASVNMANIVKLRDYDEWPFYVKDGVSNRQWNAFIVKLMQFMVFRKAVKKTKEPYKERNYYVSKFLAKSFESSYGKEIFANILAKKVTAAFFRAFDDVTSRPSVSKFFVIEKLSNYEETILFFIRKRITFLLGNLVRGISSSTTVSTQELLASAIDDKLKCRDGRLPMKHCDGVPGPDGDEQEKIKGEFEWLADSLDATVLRLLIVTPFNFATKFDEYGNLECMEEMNIVQYFEVLAKQWSEDDKTNGARLQEAEADGKKLEELLTEFLDEKQVGK
jgi:hypothetical protein